MTSIERRSTRVLGTGVYLPDRVVTNEAILEWMPATNPEWTAAKLGIKERRIAESSESTGDLALVAAQRALDDAGLQPEDLDLLILATATPRRMAPSTACHVQQRLGASRAAAFDLAAVCSGFVYSTVVAHQFISGGMYRNALVIGADTFSKITDWRRRDCVFFGDGAGAAVLSVCAAGEGILATDLGADGSGEDSWTVPGGGSAIPASHDTLDEGLHYWQMDGPSVREMALRRIPLTLSRSLKRAGLTPADIDHIVPHQAGLHVLRDAAQDMGIPWEKFHVNMARYANTAGAAVPIMLDEVCQSGQIRPGEIVVLVSVGAGWTWGSVVMRWPGP